MAIITDEVYININCKDIKYYESLGYIIPRELNKKGEYTFNRNQKINIKVKDLKINSKSLVLVQCDCCKCVKEMSYSTYNQSVKSNGEYRCIHCSQLYRKGEPLKVSNNSNKITIEQWCVENNRQDILERWDYKLNKYKPSEIYCFSQIKFYYKCPKEIHKSQLVLFAPIADNRHKDMYCQYCNSFAQWGIDNICSDFLEKYWDYKKNTVDPWTISYGSKKKVWIKCQEKDYHGSYKTNCNSFTSSNQRCPYCCNCHGIVHELDSLGELFSLSLDVWSNKNKLSPFKYSPFSKQKVWWKCPDGKHNDFLRAIGDSNNYGFRCPECQYSKGEDKISQVLISIGFEKTENIYNKNKCYIPQFTFKGLKGTGGGLLSYDFYLPNYNLLIEYQGIQHTKFVEGLHKSKKAFEKQLEHDRRKKEYAQNNNIKLLEIWYWDFDKIEEILHNEIKI